MCETKYGKIVEILLKPAPSPEPQIFESEEIELICQDNIFKIKINKEYSELIYNHLYYNSELMLWNIKNTNISWHHLYFLFKIYAASHKHSYLLNVIKIVLPLGIGLI